MKIYYAILKPLPLLRKREGCEKWVVTSGDCIQHGAKTGRKNIVINSPGGRRGGVCVRHGARCARCSHEGCDEQSKSGRCLHSARGHKRKKKGVATKDAATRFRLGVCIKQELRITSTHLHKNKGCDKRSVEGGV